MFLDIDTLIFSQIFWYSCPYDCLILHDSSNVTNLLLIDSVLLNLSQSKTLNFSVNSSGWRMIDTLKFILK